MPDGHFDHASITLDEPDAPVHKRRRQGRVYVTATDMPDESASGPDLLAALLAGPCQTPKACRLMSVALANTGNCCPGAKEPDGIDDDLNDEALRLPVENLGDVTAILGMLGQLSTNLHVNFDGDDQPVAEAARFTARMMRRILDATMPYLLRASLLSPGEIGLSDFSGVIHGAAHNDMMEHIARWTANQGVDA